MKARLRIIIAVLGLIIVPVSVFAHHNWLAEFDPDLHVVVTGTVKDFMMTNPHARLIVEEMNLNGEVILWDFELAGASMLMRGNFRKDTLKPGDRITVHAVRARNALYVGNVESFVLLDQEGEELFSFRSSASNR